MSKKNNSARAPKNVVTSEAPVLATIAPETKKAPKRQKTQAPVENATQSAPATSEAKATLVVKTAHANNAAFTNVRPGVLAFIENMLRRAESDNAPVTKSAILAACVAQFQDREESKMKTTIAMQVPSGFKIEKGYIIVSSSEGYRFDTALTNEYQKTHEKRGGRYVLKQAQTTAPEAPKA